jgi:hypothetical protein
LGEFDIMSVQKVEFFQENGIYHISLPYITRYQPICELEIKHKIEITELPHYLPIDRICPKCIGFDNQMRIAILNKKHKWEFYRQKVMTFMGNYAELIIPIGALIFSFIVGFLQQVYENRW